MTLRVRRNVLGVVAAGVTAALAVGGVVFVLAEDEGPKPSINLAEPSANVDGERQVVALMDSVVDGFSTFVARETALPAVDGDLVKMGVMQVKGDRVTFESSEGLGTCFWAWNVHADEHRSRESAVRYDSVTQEVLEPGAAPRTDGACGPGTNA